MKRVDFDFSMRRFALALVGIWAACGGASDRGDDLDAAPLPPDAALDATPPSFSGIDVLFVINDSLGMEPLHARLGSHLPGFFAALAAAEGAMPSLHVGVVSTTVNEPTGPALCVGDPGGELRPSGCLTDAARFASSVAGNYPATLADAAACMLEVGSLGCPFEQPLEAMRRALDGTRPENAGFLRDDALLVVVFLTDEDDCSSADPLLFASSASQFGPFGSFRCFQFGARCDQANPQALGPHSGCLPAEGGPMHPLADYTAFLDAIKGGPGRVVVGGLVPPETPVEVVQEGDGRFVLRGVCPDVSQGVQTWPAIRMHGFARALSAGDATPLGSMCAPDWTTPLTALAQRIANAYRE